MKTVCTTGAPPKVSVIVPNYNHASYLPQRIESILGQSFQDFEIIFLDDKSTDDSLKVLAQYANHPKVVGVVSNDVNGGSPYLQWNRGARMARGQYIWLAESDDYAATSFLSRLVSILDAQPNVGLVYCQSFKIDTDSRVFGRTDDWTRDLDASRWDQDYTNNGRDECARFMIRRCIIPNVSSAVLRRSILEEIGYAEQDMKYCGDYLTYVRMLEVSDIAYVADPLNYFRFSNTTVRTQMTNAWRHDHERAQIIAYISKRFVVPEMSLEAARDSLLERLMRASVSSRKAVQVYFSNYTQTRSIITSFCPFPEIRAAKLAWNFFQRKVGRLVRRAMSAI